MPSIFNPFMTEAVTYRNQSVDLLRKSMEWFLYDSGLRYKRVKYFLKFGMSDVYNIAKLKTCEKLVV